MQGNRGGDIVLLNIAISVYQGIPSLKYQWTQLQIKTWLTAFSQFSLSILPHDLTHSIVHLAVYLFICNSLNSARHIMHSAHCESNT